jgi:hypothetical protein
MKRRQNRQKKLNRKGMRKIMLKTLLEAINPSSIGGMTINDVIAKINSGEMTRSELTNFIRDNSMANSDVRAQVSAQRATTEGEKTQKAKQIIAYYLSKNYESLDFGDLDSTDMTAKSEFEEFYDTKEMKRVKDEKTGRPVRRQVYNKFTVKMAEQLVYHAFIALGVEFADEGLVKLNPQPTGRDSARDYATRALAELEASNLVITNTDVPGVTRTGKKIGFRGGEFEVSDDIPAAVDAVNPDMLKREGLSGLREMILKEVMEVMPGLSSDIMESEVDRLQKEYVDSTFVSGINLNALKLLASALEDGDDLVINNIPLTDIEGDISLGIEDLGL